MFFPGRAFASLLLTACNHPTHATTIPPNPCTTTHATTHHPPPTRPSYHPTRPTHLPHPSTRRVNQACKMLPGAVNQSTRRVNQAYKMLPGASNQSTTGVNQEPPFEVHFLRPETNQNMVPPRWASTVGVNMVLLFATATYKHVGKRRCRPHVGRRRDRS